MNGKLLLRIPEVATATGVSRSAIYRDIQNGRLRACHRGRSVFIKAGDLIDYVDQLQESA